MFLVPAAVVGVLLPAGDIWRFFSTVAIVWQEVRQPLYCWGVRLAEVVRGREKEREEEDKTR